MPELRGKFAYVVDRIQRRLGEEDGFTLVELLNVMMLLAIVIMIALPSYLDARAKSELTAALSNVRNAIPAAETYYQDPFGGNGRYTGISWSKLNMEAPGVGRHVKGAANAAGTGYCVEDSENGSTYYSYTGGVGGTATITLGACSILFPNPA